MTGIISIGRSTKGKDLSDARWRRFIRDTIRAAGSQGRDVVFTGRGAGRYTDAIGQTIFEKSFTVIFTELGYAHVWFDARIDLRETLAGLARKYGQECIALTYGATEFVS